MFSGKSEFSFHTLLRSIPSCIVRMFCRNSSEFNIPMFTPLADDDKLVIIFCYEYFISFMESNDKGFILDCRKFDKELKEYEIAVLFCEAVCSFIHNRHICVLLEFVGTNTEF